MSKHRRHWSESEKKAILQYYQEHGASSAARQFEVSTSMIYRWASDSSSASVKEVESTISSKEYHRLLRENQALKELVAEKELEIRIKSDRRSGCPAKKNFPTQQERLIVAQEFIGTNLPKNKVLALCCIARSSYYYRPSEGKQGRKPYAKVVDKNGKIIDNEIVIEYIHQLFNHPFVDYGYYKTYIYLRRKKQLNLSKHLVYRLMKSHQLLRNQYVNSSKKSKRNWVKDLLPQVEIAFCYLEFDIKFVWVAGQNRNMQVLTVLDVYSRWNISHYMSYSIKYQDVIGLFERIFEYMIIPERMYVRCDNGAQFIAEMVQKYFKDKQVVQEFTKPATPQQNSHIESYHSIMESAVCQKFEFSNISDAKEIMNQFRDFYNFERIHSGINFQSPAEFLLQKGIDMKSNPINRVPIL